jgi:hypothetical protein
VKPTHKARKVTRKLRPLEIHTLGASDLAKAAGGGRELGTVSYSGSPEAGDDTMGDPQDLVVDWVPNHNQTSMRGARAGSR